MSTPLAQKIKALIRATGPISVTDYFAMCLADPEHGYYRTREPFGRLVAVGIVAILAAQTFLNIAVTLKLMPVTGVTLPFISAGGSSLIASYMAAGLLLNIGQHRPLVMANDSFEYED